MNSTITIYTTESPITSSETNHNHCVHTVQQLLLQNDPMIVFTLTSVVYDDAKVCVGGFVLRSFGRHRDDGRLGRILVGGGALL